jgi:enolase
LAKWVNKISNRKPLEDGLAEDDWAGWQNLTETVGRSNASLSATIYSLPTPSVSQRHINGHANSILIKLHSNRHADRDFEAINMAREPAGTAVISHRSGETETAQFADGSCNWHWSDQDRLGCRMSESASTNSCSAFTKNSAMTAQ